MPRSRLDLVAATPGVANLTPWLRKACDHEGAKLVALTPGRLRALAGSFDEDVGPETASFSDLLCHSLAFCGGFPRRIASETLQVAAMAEVCRGLPEDGCFFRARHFPGFHRALCQTLSDLREWNVTPASLRQAANRADGYLRQKLGELAEIESEFRGLLNDLNACVQSEIGDDVEASMPDPGTELPPTVFVADSHFTPRRAQWIRWAIETGSKVSVALERHDGRERAFEGSVAYSTFLGLKPKEIGQANGWVSGMFGGIAGPGGPSASIWSTADPFAEAEWVVRSCLADLEEGLSQRQIAIVVRDLGSYVPYLHAAAGRFGLPLDMPHRELLSTNGFTRLVVSVLEFCLGDDVRLLRPILASTYGTRPNMDVATVREAIEVARKSDDPWKSLREWWNTQRETVPWLGPVMDWRQEARGASRSLLQWNRQLDDLMDVGDWATDIQGPSYLTERDNRAKTQIQTSLNMHGAVARARNKGPIDLRTYVELAKNVWADTESTVRDKGNGVWVVSQAEALPAVDRLYVMGLLEGSLPKRRSEDPVLWDRERQFLDSELRHEFPLPCSRSKARAERDEFFRMCCSASEKLVLTYPQTDDARDNVPAFYLDEVRRVSPHVDERAFPRSSLYPVENLWLERDVELANGMTGPRREPTANVLQSASIAERLRLGQGEAVTIERVLDAIECPFRQVARHGLRLRGRDAYRPFLKLADLPTEAGLATLVGNPEEAAQTLGMRLDQVIDEMGMEIGAEESSAIAQVGRRMIHGWVEREACAQRIWPRSEIQTNVALGSEKTHNELPFAGGRLPVIAKIPSLWRSGDVVGATFYHFGTPKKRDGGLSQRDWVRLKVWLLLLFQRGASYHLEVDGASGKRVAYVFGPLTTGTRANDSGTGLERDLVAESMPLLQQEAESVKVLVGSAATNLYRPAVEATPSSENCKYCAFGELCRRSNEFGEGDSFSG